MILLAQVENDLGRELAWHRAYKTDFEISILKEANALAAKGHLKAYELFKEGATELEIHLAYMQTTSQKEIDLPYASIIAQNEKAAILHSNEYSDTRKKSYSFLIDAGASVGGYGSDITRTYVHPTLESSLFAAVLKRMQNLQKQICEMMVLEMPFDALHQKAYDAIAQLLCDVGLFEGTVEDCLAEGVVSVFFPHGLGHLLGVQTHDIGGYFMNEQDDFARIEKHPFLRCRRILQANMVVTIEPGLYFIDSLLSHCKSLKINKALVNELKPFGGIRIEDNIYLNKNNSVVNLTTGFLNI